MNHDQGVVKEQGKAIHRIEIQNRKYLGNKYRLLGFLKNAITQRVPLIGSFGDLFCGTGVVSFELGKEAESLVANDMLYSGYVVCQAFFGQQSRDLDLNKIESLLLELKELAPSRGYFFQTFGGNYFTPENAAQIDSTREAIALWEKLGRITQSEKWQLLTSLIYAVDKAANIVGQYDAYMKNMGAPVYSQEGHHLVDVNVYRPLQLGLPCSRPHGDARILQQDANRVISEHRFHVLYLDPPYNNRQYIDLYHVLENLAIWHKPEVFGKTRKFERRHLKSDFSRKKRAAKALANLISKARAEHIFLSYNNEGMLKENEIQGILSTRGKVEKIEEDYQVFGKGAGQSRRRMVKEQLYYLKPLKSPQK
ncbi:MAG: DNA adenine methylase [Spirochaetales bacterium]|nr:DNA adenine methylase [Spirochaetales bacterium]